MITEQELATKYIKDSIAYMGKVTELEVIEGKFYLTFENGMSFQLSAEEINYRAELQIESIKEALT